MSAETPQNVEHARGAERRTARGPAARIRSFLNLVVGVSLLGLCYVGVIVPTVSIVFHVDLPQLVYTPKPRQVALVNPSYKGPSKKEVRPEEIQRILDSHPYNHIYEPGVFDCSDMSKITAKLLQEQYGYDTSVIGDDRYHHAWVYVWTGKNTAWAIETTAETSLLRGSAGEVVGLHWWDIVFLGHWLEPEAWALSVTGYNLYYPTTKRDGLQIREWYQVEKGR